MPFDRFTTLFVIDDSGDFAPVVKVESGKVFARRPKNTVGTFGVLQIRQKAVAELSHKWLTLQTRIQKRLNTPYLPPIHLRLMWALKSEDRPRLLNKKLPNPYKKASADDIYCWVEEAFSILRGFEKSGALKMQPLSMDLINAYNGWDSILNNPQLELAKEYEFLIKQVSSKPVRVFLNILSSPYIGGLTEFLLGLADPSNRANLGKVGVVLDNTQDVIGFEASQVLSQYIESNSHTTQLEFLGEAKKLGLTANELPLLQASDLVAYFYRRAQEGDPVSKQFATQYLAFAPDAINKRVVQLPRTRRQIAAYNQRVLAQMIQRYEHAYRHAKDASKQHTKAFEALVLTPEAFRHRLAKALGAGKRPIKWLTVSVLKEPFDRELWVIYE